jgi:multidrug efflux pump subunit AcrA (membrane-fusion protein)
MVDITPEAVDRLAKSLAFVANRTGMTVDKCEQVTDQSAATLRALYARAAELEAEQASRSAMFATAHEELAAAQAALATARADALREAAPKPCDGKEQYAFEAWAKGEGYNMQEHPLHYIFLAPKTNAARMGWNACILYQRAAILALAEGGEE